MAELNNQKTTDFGIINDPVVNLSAEIQDSKIVNSACNWSKAKTPDKEYRSEYIASIAILIVSIAIALYFASFFALRLIEYNAIVVICVSVLIFVSLYVYEITNVSQIIRRLHLNKYLTSKIRISFFRFFSAIFVSMFNIVIVFLGIYFNTQISKETAKNDYNAIFSKDSLLIVNEYNNEKKRIIEQIEYAKDAYTIDGQLSYKGSGLIANLENELAKEKTILEKKLAAIETQNTEILTEKTEKIEEYIWLKLLVGIVIEFLILSAIFGITIYKVRIYVYAASLEAVKTPQKMRQESETHVVKSEYKDISPLTSGDECKQTDVNAFNYNTDVLQTSIPCVQCGTLFDQYRKGHKFCSTKCRQKHNNFKLK